MQEATDIRELTLVELGEVPSRSWLEMRVA